MGQIRTLEKSFLLRRIEIEALRRSKALDNIPIVGYCFRPNESAFLDK